MNQIHDRGFPIRSSYADDEKTFGRISIQKISNLTIQLLSSLIEETVLEDIINLIIEDDFFDECFEHQIHLSDKQKNSMSLYIGICREKKSLFVFY